MSDGWERDRWPEARGIAVGALARRVPELASMGAWYELEDILQEAFLEWRQFAECLTEDERDANAWPAKWSRQLSHDAGRLLRRRPYRWGRSERQALPPVLDLPRRLRPVEDRVIARLDAREAIKWLRREASGRFLSRAVEGATAREEAERAGISVGAVYERRWRARRELREVLGYGPGLWPGDGSATLGTSFERRESDG